MLVLNKEFNTIFSFNKTNENEVSKTIKNLNVRKTCQGSDIQTKIIKVNIDLFSSFICQYFNYYISIGEVPNELKHTNVLPVHTKKDKCDKTNYRPVSIIPNTLNFFPSPYGFRERYSSQHSFLVMTDKFKESIDKGNVFGALLTDLSKAFDCSDHTLLTAKLIAFGVSDLSLKLIYSTNSTSQNQ